MPEASLSNGGTTNERLSKLLSGLESISYIKPEDIPNIQLYMDQVTTFMDEHLKHTKRYPDDKVLTKTMINNYAKNNLLPPPVKKKYSKEHMLMLIFIYYFKNMLSFHDIETLFGPITEEHFHAGAVQTDKEDSLWSLEDVYRQIFSLEKEQMKRLKEDILRKFRAAKETFPQISQESGTKESLCSQTDQEYLQVFSFICALGFDVYLKKQLMELLIDQIREEHPSGGKKKK